MVWQLLSDGPFLLAVFLKIESRMDWLLPVPSVAAQFLVAVSTGWAPVAVLFFVVAL